MQVRAIKTVPLWWVLALLAVAPQALAERRGVLPLIDVPHDYYYREMYLPQVSSQPQAPAWSPDSRTLVYTMQGSLWRQDVDSTIAIQLTAGPGYDHQPDWSPDGRYIVFTRYHADAMELQLLDTDSGKITPLTSGGDVNLEPRYSPDGERLAFVSTTGSGRFHLFVGRIENGRLQAVPLLKERRSEVPRYYYSAFDHEISPSWAPDGRSLYYVGNAEIPYGSGAVWQVSLDDPERPRLVRQEETTWRARPDIAPDGRRLAYSSYLGRQWHQLWLTSVVGSGEPFPLSYGDYDVSGARWSPDGKRIAYAVNESGNTALRVLNLPGGKVDRVEVTERRFLLPVGSLKLAITDASGRPVPARVSVTASDGRAYAPYDRWAHADDGYDRGQRDEEQRYFHAYGDAVVELPAGHAEVTVWRGLESGIQRLTSDIVAGGTAVAAVSLRPLALPPAFADWRSADVHVHMNYGGIYRNTPANLVRQAEAEDLDVVFNLIVNKEQRIPDVSYFSGSADDRSNRNVVLQHSQEFHSSYWGHLGMLGLSDHLLLPDYSAYPETAAASIYPDNATATDLAHEQGALVGYVHPFLYPLPDPQNDASLTNALPVDVALGRSDYYEVVGFADHRASADIWYRLLNCGFRVAAAGGTDAMANFASLRGPVGVNRTYVQVANWPDSADGRRDAWLTGLQAGRSFATNGPLLGFSVAGRLPGDTITIDGATRLHYQGYMRSIVPVEHLEVVLNGKVLRSIDLSDEASGADFEGEVSVTDSGWLVLRAWSDDSHPDVFDLYPYATTSPVYVDAGDGGPRSSKDAAYFLEWVERLRESAVSHPDYNTEGERQAVLDHIDAAAAAFRDRL